MTESQKALLASWKRSNYDDVWFPPRSAALVRVRIRAADFCCAIMVRDDVVIETAPKLKEMLGWSADQVRAHCRRQGWIATKSRPHEG